MKTTNLLLFTTLFFLFALPDVYAEPDINVVPISYDFGEVEAGSSETVLILISNVGDSSITIEDISFKPGSSTDYNTSPSLFLPVFFSAGFVFPVEITFTPSDDNPSQAILEITSSDPDEPVVEVLLTWQGRSGAGTPLDQIETILDFADTAVEDETLIGNGPGKSAKNRLNALLNMLEKAKLLIEEERYEEACELLKSAYKHTDGQNRPPDFVTGPAAMELADKIMELITALECD